MEQNGKRFCLVRQTDAIVRMCVEEELTDLDTHVSALLSAENARREILRELLANLIVQRFKKRKNFLAAVRKSVSYEIITLR